MTDFAVVIPCRYASTRLPGKPLREINGKPMLEHVHARAVESSAGEIVVATDDDRIATAAEGFGARVCLTREEHRSGTDRIAEVCDQLGWDDDRIVVNLQGDEPTMPAALIDQCAGLLGDRFADIATLASPLESARDLGNENVVKVVVDRAGNAIYFSRAAIPFVFSSLHQWLVSRFSPSTGHPMQVAELGGQQLLYACHHTFPLGI